MHLVNLEMNVGTVQIQAGQFEASLAACDAPPSPPTNSMTPRRLDGLTSTGPMFFRNWIAMPRPNTVIEMRSQVLVASHQNRQQVALVDLNLGLLALRRSDFWQALQHLEAGTRGLFILACPCRLGRFKPCARSIIDSTSTPKRSHLAAAAVDAADHQRVDARGGNGATSVGKCS